MTRAELLKSQYKDLKSHLPDNLALRIHRSISWLNKAEQEENDPDASFIFLWISFNALYGAEIDPEERISERNKHSDFFYVLLENDETDKLYDIVWKKYSDSIRLILNNKYIYQKFWDFHNGVNLSNDWERSFVNRQSLCRRALSNKDTFIIIRTLFRRLYTLRNQLVHGGATWGGYVNREQVISGSKILGSLVPVFIELMLNLPHLDWGKPNYPVVS